MISAKWPLGKVITTHPGNVSATCMLIDFLCNSVYYYVLTKWWLVHTLASLLLLLFVWLCASGGPAHLYKFDFVGFVQFMQNNKFSSV